MSLILISHGALAQGLLNTAEMIVGEIPKAQSVSLEPHESVEDFTAKFEQALANAEGKITVLCDILGGTPCNVAMRYLDRISLYSGMNLPMVISYVSEEGETDLIDNSKEQIYNVAERLSQLNGDDDE
ncbi:PTS sugar transporter subunit IIA [Pasteurellaceae bacterium Macca]|nr:PTS sugar transporter subunit IIA [Pasteurellaceae bacterium Macca]